MGKGILKSFVLAPWNTADIHFLLEFLYSRSNSKWTSLRKLVAYLYNCTVDGRNPASQLRLLLHPIVYSFFLHPRLVFSPDFYHQHHASQVRVASSAWKSAMEIFKDCSGRCERWRDDVFAKTGTGNLWKTTKCLMKASNLELPIGFTCYQHTRYQTECIVQHQVPYL